MDKVQTIEGSLRCFWRSLFGLIPVLGLPFAIHSVFVARRLRRDGHGHWNPAGRYLNWGAIFGWIGIGLTVMACVAVTLFVIHIYSDGNSND
ncbi:MAG TPA: hypothetical protein VN048_05525 [Verrucomicrobiae bacterium]|jgi:hypothetical protein|nr:hypothetical protein [Verrucomicrobiae bacterium]